jgi:hypothetical protein
MNSFKEFTSKFLFFYYIQQANRIFFLFIDQKIQYILKKIVKIKFYKIFKDKKYNI